ncbi:MAG: hypothetical protein MJZ06_01380 [Bacteroidaceae bacterium]|nr:hypothetical protein [Bacteroidaceae bacterium]
MKTYINKKNRRKERRKRKEREKTGRAWCGTGLLLTEEATACLLKAEEMKWK